MVGSRVRVESNALENASSVSYFISIFFRYAIIINHLPKYLTHLIRPLLLLVFFVSSCLFRIFQIPDPYLFYLSVVCSSIFLFVISCSLHFNQPLFSVFVFLVIMSSTLGHVDSIAPAGNSVARLIRDMEINRIKPTHFLLINFTYHARLEQRYKTRVTKALFGFLNGKKWQVTLGDTEDPISITWKSPNINSSLIYWTISRLDEQYVRQMTAELLTTAHGHILQQTRLQPGNFQMTWIVAKNLNYSVDLAQAEDPQFMGALTANQPQQAIGQAVDHNNMAMLPVTQVKAESSDEEKSDS